MVKQDFPFFKLNQWGKVGFRLIKWDGYFQGAYLGKIVRYYGFQEVTSGYPYLFALTSEEEKRLQSKLKEYSISEANYDQYVIYFWRRARMNPPSSAKKFRWELTIESIEKLPKKTFDRLVKAMVMIREKHLKVGYIK